MEDGRWSVTGDLEGDLSGSCTGDLLLLLEFFTASFDGDSETDLCLLLREELAHLRILHS